MDKQQEKQFKVFSYGLPLICLFLAWRQYTKHGINVWVDVFFIAAVIVIGLNFLAKPWLRILFKFWMEGAHFIGTIITAIILTVVFGVIFMPVSMVLRLMSKDFLHLRKINKDSYWIKREAKLADYTQQF